MFTEENNKHRRFFFLSFIDNINEQYYDKRMHASYSH